MRSSRLHVLPDQHARRDLLPLELLGERLEHSLLLSAGRAKQKDPLASAGLDFLQDELVGVLGACDHDLPDQVLEQLVYLVLVQIRLNGLHEVHFLHFIHLPYYTILLRGTTYLLSGWDECFFPFFVGNNNLFFNNYKCP